MGNVISSIQHRIVKSEDVPTPPLQSLSASQVEIVKRTWEIPAARVSFSAVFRNLINASLHLVATRRGRNNLVSLL